MKKIIINCIEDEAFEYSRDIIHACRKSFYLDEINIFGIQTVGYFDETIKQYYTICPHCGYIVLLDENELTEELKQVADNIYLEDPNLYKKNNLRSQLIHLESITTKVRTRRI